MIKAKNTPITFELLVTDLFGQVKTDISSVSLRVFHRENGVEIEDLSTKSMNGDSGKYYYEYSQGFDTGEYVIEYTITDNDSEVYKQYEKLTVGYLEEDIALIKDIESGVWEIKDNKMIFYKEDGVTEVIKFDLFDDKGKPSMETVFKRSRI